MDTEDAIVLIKALSSESRLRILRVLRDQPLCAGAIARELDITFPSASQNLRVLRSAGLVEGRRRGNHVHYSLVPERLRLLGRVLEGLIPVAETDSETDRDDPCGMRQCREGR